AGQRGPGSGPSSQVAQGQIVDLPLLLYGLLAGRAQDRPASRDACPQIPGLQVRPQAWSGPEEVMTVAKTLFKKAQMDLGQGLVATGVQVVLPERPITWDGGAVEAWARVLLNGTVWVQGLSVIRDEKRRVYRLTVPGRKSEWNGRS